MHIVQPSWVLHQDDKKKKTSIFSIHVHPDGSRVATGGLDTKVRIWTTAPILDEGTSLRADVPKSLCTLTVHTGAVLAVRWANSGRFLASGSDDTVIMIYDRSPGAFASKAFGSTEENVENWRYIRRLSGHESDVTDLAWSKDDEYLASVGLDSKVFVWSGQTFDPIRRIEVHSGFVKGVTWDPAGQYLATASDDRSVKIFRTTDWGLEKDVTEPFEGSPSSTFYRRLGWSPEGAHLVASNAMNGPVFAGSVIARESWNTDVTLLGHENCTECVAFSPQVFLKIPSHPSRKAENVCTMLALAGQDRTLSVWLTKWGRPLVVLKDVFERNVLDLSWSPDGHTLFACSSDGTIACVVFTPDELPTTAEPGTKEECIAQIGFKWPVHQPAPSVQPSSSTLNGLGHQYHHGTHAPVQTLPAVPQPQSVTITKDGRRRIQPSLIAVGASSPVPAPSLPFATANREPEVEMPAPVPPLLPPPSEPSLPTPTTSSSAPMARGKGRTLGGDKPREPAGAPVELRAAQHFVSGAGAAAPSTRVTGGGTGPAVVFPVPSVKSNARIKTNEENADSDILEMRNFTDGRACEVTLLHPEREQGKMKDKVLWIDYLPSPILAMTATLFFSAVATEDGGINIYSATGRHLMPTITLDSPLVNMDSADNLLMAITASGVLHTWDVKRQRAVRPPTSFVHLLSTPGVASGELTISDATLLSNGAPVLSFTTGTAYTYHDAMQCWVRLSSAWWADGSDAWDGRMRGNRQGTTGRGVVRGIEARINDVVAGREDAPMDGSAAFGDGANGRTGIGSVPVHLRGEYWDAALSLGHLEARMSAAALLDSPTEYRQFMQQYARKLGEEGFRGKAEELLRELIGPIYYKARDDAWQPTIVGLDKRALVKEVLSIFGKSKTLIALGQQYADLLRKMSGDDLFGV